MAAQRWIYCDYLATLALIARIATCYAALGLPDQASFIEALFALVGGHDSDQDDIDLDGITVASILRTWHADSDVPIMRLLG